MSLRRIPLLLMTALLLATVGGSLVGQTQKPDKPVLDPGQQPVEPPEVRAAGAT